MRSKLWQLVVTVAFVGVICGGESARRRRKALLTLATTTENEAFQLRGEARRLVVLANLYQKPPGRQDELEAKWEEMHPLPQLGHNGFYPTMNELTRHGEDWRRGRSMKYREVAAAHLREVAKLARRSRELQLAAYFPWESIPPDRPLPAAHTLRSADGLYLHQ